MTFSIRNNSVNLAIYGEEDITVGDEFYLVGFTITANIDKGEMPSRDNPGEPPSVDEWVNLKIDYVHGFDGYRHEIDIEAHQDTPFFKQQILERAEAAGMEWVDNYDDCEN